MIIELAETPRRPADLALLLLAVEREFPRKRARDQFPDIAGGRLWKLLLNRVASRDPEHEDLEETLEGFCSVSGDAGPGLRGLAARFRDEWRLARVSPEFWNWLIRQALEDVP